MKVLALAKAQQPADQPAMLLYKDCVGKGNYTTNSTYQANLNQLLTSIYTNTEINNGFYNFSYGQDADTVYSIALCRPDIRPDDCRSCIRNASDSLVRNCPNFVEAIGGLDNCMVRYTNRSIFNRMEQGPYFWVYDDRLNVSDVVRFNQSRMTLLGRLSDQAAAGDSRYKRAMGQIADDGNFRIIYALVQCTPDLSASACRDCLYNASGLIPQCCNARQGGRVIYPSCNFRYEIDRFYDPSTNSIPPPPDSTVTNSIPSPPASTSPGKKGKKRNVVVVIVPIGGSVILIACVCIFLRARKQKEDEEVKALQKKQTSHLLMPKDCFVVDLYEMEDVELLQLDFGTIREATGNFSEFNKLGQGGFGVVYKSWRKWIEGTPLDIIDPTLNAGPKSEIMRSIHIGLVCVQENEALRPTMAQVSMMLRKKGKKRNVVVVIVPIAGSVILIACVCIFLRARKQKEEEEVKASMVELVDKILTHTDLENRLAFPAESLWAFPILSQGQTSVSFDARDALGKVWNLKLSTRTGHQKPVITKDWLLLVQEKSLQVGDRIVLNREVDEEDRVSYEIRAAHEIFSSWVPVI
ncbi:hypothetical protein SADUNF_Sadunf11G0015400 [Salix dunnii]|uniref:Gnk2-homologous domain-containing protein n=1 Tax=Salix dunnii TaxID=1413687 RepID=A0A835JJS9_9ROSI|nr:hypothetical protein SADUNF_Sadunf11G0015400 [Salix dunnii]